MEKVSPASSSSSSLTLNLLVNWLVLRVYSYFTPITSQTLDSFGRLLIELDVTPDLLVLSNQELYIMFTSRRAAANAAVTF